MQSIHQVSLTYIELLKIQLIAIRCVQGECGQLKVDRTQTDKRLIVQLTIAGHDRLADAFDQIGVVRFVLDCTDRLANQTDQSIRRSSVRQNGTEQFDESL